MKNPKHLFSFSVNYEKISLSFSVYGEYSVAERRSNKYYFIPVFSNVYAVSVENGTESDSKLTGPDIDEMLNEYLAGITQHNPVYKTIYMEEGLRKILYPYISDEAIAFTVNAHPISRHILDEQFQLHELCLITDKYIYYSGPKDNYNNFYMYDANTHTLICKNRIAFESYSVSLKNIFIGKEKSLWSESVQSELGNEKKKISFDRKSIGKSGKAVI